jgi:hypothetical protein
MSELVTFGKLKVGTEFFCSTPRGANRKYVKHGEHEGFCVDDGNIYHFRRSTEVDVHAEHATNLATRKAALLKELHDGATLDEIPRQHAHKFSAQDWSAILLFLQFKASQLVVERRLH